MSQDLITLFIPSVHGGGAERAMLVFASELVKLKYLVDLVLVKLEGAHISRIPLGVRVIDLNSRRMLLALPKLMSYLVKNKPRAIFSTITHANIALAIAAKYARVSCPVIARQSNAPLSETKDSFGRRIAGRLIPRAYKSVSGVIAVSDGVRDELLELSSDLEGLISVIPTPVISDEMLGEGQEPTGHPWLLHDREAPVIVSAGRLEKHKGMLELIRAFYIVRQEIDARLIILGEGSQQGELEAVIDSLGLKQVVDLHGFKTNPFGYMNQANLFVLASHYEGLPNVLIQAMAFGTPVVATDCPSGPLEILDHGRLGKLVKVGDINALAEAIKSSLFLPKSDDARDSVLERFGAREATRRYLECAGVTLFSSSANGAGSISSYYPKNGSCGS